MGMSYIIHTFNKPFTNADRRIWQVFSLPDRFSETDHWANEFCSSNFYTLNDNNHLS